MRSVPSSTWSAAPETPWLSNRASSRSVPPGNPMRQPAMPVDFSCRLVRFGARQWYRQFARHPNQLSERFGLHLAHDAAAVNLQRGFADAEFGSGLFVEETTDNQR